QREWGFSPCDRLLHLRPDPHQGPHRHHLGPGLRSLPAADYREQEGVLRQSDSREMADRLHAWGRDALGLCREGCGREAVGAGSLETALGSSNCCQTSRKRPHSNFFYSDATLLSTVWAGALTRATHFPGLYTSSDIPPCKRASQAPLCPLLTSSLIGGGRSSARREIFLVWAFAGRLPFTHTV